MICFSKRNKSNKMDFELEKTIYESGLNYSTAKTLNYEHPWVFIRGIFDVCGVVLQNERTAIFFMRPEIKDELLKYLTDIIDVKYRIKNNMITFSGTNSIDFLSKIYDNANPELRSRDCYDLYLNQLYEPYGLKYRKLLECKFIKARDDAVIPKKVRASDEGYDITIIDIDKVISKKTTRYETGIRIQPEPGYHVELIPRSSLSNSGYRLTNCIGMIDEPYNGTLKIALTKEDKSFPDLVLPFTGIQMLLRKSVHYILKQTDTFEETSRGEGGFGSTN